MILAHVTVSHHSVLAPLYSLVLYVYALSRLLSFFFILYYIYYLFILPFPLPPFCSSNPITSLPTSWN